jgi:hypothetical protein
VDSSYFETLGLPLTRGRTFSEVDGTGGHDAVIVSQRFVEMFCSGTDPLGQRIQLMAAEKPKGDERWLTIVGVSPNVAARRNPPPDPLVYLPFNGAPPATAALIVRAPRDAGVLAPLLREEVRALDPDLPLYRVMTLDQVNWEAGWNPRLSARLITVIACIALGLSTLGLVAMTAHGVAQRGHEIGIRMTLGAKPRQIVTLVLRRALMQVTVGLIVGAVFTVIWERLIFSATSIAGPRNLLLVAVVFTIVAMGACVWPARRAARLDPVRALRHQ